MPKMSPERFLRTLDRARTASANEDWEEAARLWKQVVDTNPVDGSFWQQLAEARRHTEDFRSAIAAYEEMARLGAGYPFRPPYEIARCYARLCEDNAALDALARAFDLGYRNIEGAQREEDFAALRESPRFGEIVGLVDADAMARDDGWRYDLRFLMREIRRKSHHLPPTVPDGEIDAMAGRLHDAIPQLSDVQIAIEMAKILQQFGDGHASINVLDEEAAKQQLPLLFFWFEEGMYIVGAAPQYGDLVGARVDRVGGHAVEEIADGLLPIIWRDNEYWPRYIVPERTRCLPLLHALDLAPDPAQVELSLTLLDGHMRTVAVHTDSDRVTAEAWRRTPCPEEWVFLPRTLSAPLPLYVQNAGAPYWFTYLPEHRLVYFQFNQVADGPEEPLADFSRRLFAFIDSHDVIKLVVDLRWNGGGNTFLEVPLLHGLIACDKVNRRGQLFVIIGRRTFSAAQNGATLIERHTEAIFVGEPTGSRPNFHGESIHFRLPYSKRRANISDLYHQSGWPMDYRTWIAPLIFAPPTFEAYRQNRDPALEAVLAWSDHLPGL